MKLIFDIFSMVVFGIILSPFAFIGVTARLIFYGLQIGWQLVNDFILYITKE